MPEQQQACAQALRVSGAALEAVGGEGGEGAWSALALHGEEAVNALFDYELLLRQHAGPVRPGQWLGRALDLRLELGLPGQPPQPPRWIHGEVSQVAHLGHDGRGNLLALRLRPWAWRACLRGSCRAWRGRSVPEVLQQLVGPGHGAGSVRLRLRERYPARDYLVQFNQTDWECFARLAAEWGINFWFEHRQGAHDLVLGDHNGACGEQPAAAWSRITVGARERESLLSLRHGHALRSLGWSTRDDDYTRADALPAFDADADEAPGMPVAAQRRQFQQFQQFHWRGDAGTGVAQPRQGAPWAAQAGPEAPPCAAEEAVHGAQALARARLQALRQHVGRARGAGPLRGLAAGHRVRLHGHRLAALADDWLVLSTSLWLREPAAEAVPWLASACGPAEQPPVRGWGDAGRPWRLARFPPQALETAHGWQLHTDVVLQRAGRPLRADLPRAKARVGGVQTARVADAEPAPDGGVRTDAYGRVRVRFGWDREGPVTSPAMRVAMPWAGQALGRQHVPRLGEELVVAFIDGELERPVGLGALYNACRRPGWPLPRGRVLGGVLSREWPGSHTAAPVRGNRLLLDDTPGALQAQFASDHLHSGLALGSIARVRRGEGLCERRGDGVELRTDGHGLLHSAGPMLLSTHAHPEREGRAAHAGESLRILGRARQWRAALARAAGDAVPGGPASAAASQDLLLGAAQGFALAGDTRVHALAGGTLSLGAAGHIGLHAAGDLLAQAGQGLRVFAQRLGLRLLAAAGPAHVHACSAGLHATAELGLCVRAAADLRVQAGRGVLLQGGCSFLRVGPGGIEYGGQLFAVRSAGLRLPRGR